MIKLDRIADAKAVFDQAKSKGAQGEGFEQIEKRLGPTTSKKSNAKEPPQEQLKPLINLYTKGHYKEVQTQVSQLLKEFPNSINLYNMLGAANQGLGNLYEAIEAFKKALSIKPDYAEACSNMGNAFK